jgi:serralysin
MVHDIAAIQRIYGADTTTRTGDTTYGFHSNADRAYYDFEQAPTPVVAIYDAGGTDTLDLSGYDTPSIIDLNPGSYSSAGGYYSEDIPTLEEINANRAEAGLAARTQATYDLYLDLFGDGYTNGVMRDNIGIAYGTWIENAKGGSGDDVIIGNAVANILDGGAGTDTVSYRGADSGVTLSLASLRGTGGDAAGDRYVSIEQAEGSAFADTLGGGNNGDGLSGLAGDDTLNGFNGADTLEGGDGNDSLSGGNHDDTLDGGAGDDALDGGNHNDVLLGGDGDDNLSGGNHNDVLNGGAGNDVLVGGNQNDVFAFTDLGGTDVVADFRRGQDKIDLSDLDAVTGGDHDAFSWIGASAFSGHAGELRSFSSGGDHFLAGDVNGDGLADFTIETNVAIVQADIIFA